jgi:hypothetical protein
MGLAGADGDRTRATLQLDQAVAAVRRSAAESRRTTSAARRPRPSGTQRSVIDKTTRSTIEDESRRLVSLALRPLAVRVGDAVGQLLLSDAERASGLRVTINLESLVRGFGLELSEGLSRYVLAGVMSRSEARRAIGLPDRADTDTMLQPVNAETVDQAQQRQDRADQQAEAATAAAANTNIAASLTRQLDGLRPVGLDIAGKQLETAGIIASSPDRLFDWAAMQFGIAYCEARLGHG